MNYGLKQTADIDALALTRLELIGLTLAANGFCTLEIASRLSVSDAEIERALVEAEAKLGANNRLHAIAIAIRQGLIGIEVKG
jgi:DNA-binding NarL/FixJ family response regulator